jgi:hypothetical protein
VCGYGLNKRSSARQRSTAADANSCRWRIHGADWRDSQCSRHTLGPMPGSVQSAAAASGYGTSRSPSSHADPPPGFAASCAAEPVMNLALHMQPEHQRCSGGSCRRCAGSMWSCRVSDITNASISTGSIACMQAATRKDCRKADLSESSTRANGQWAIVHGLAQRRSHTRCSLPTAPYIASGWNP